MKKYTLVDKVPDNDPLRITFEVVEIPGTDHRVFAVPMERFELFRATGTEVIYRLK